MPPSSQRLLRYRSLLSVLGDLGGRIMTDWFKNRSQGNYTEENQSFKEEEKGIPEYH